MRESEAACRVPDDGLSFVPSSRVEAQALIARIDSDVTNLEERIDVMETEVLRLRRVRAALVQFLSPTPQTAPGATHFQRIHEFLEGRPPQTLAEISDGTGIPRGCVSAVLYRTHRANFESTKMAPHPRKWRLAEKGPYA